MVNIHIAEHNDFHCPLGWTVEQARNEIRSSRLLMGGEIVKQWQPLTKLPQMVIITLSIFKRNKVNRLIEFFTMISYLLLLLLFTSFLPRTQTHRLSGDSKITTSQYYIFSFYILISLDHHNM